MVDYSMSAADKAIMEKLQDFLPEKIFDAHAHVHRLDQTCPNHTLVREYGETTAKRFMEAQAAFFGRPVRGFMLAYPTELFQDAEGVRDVNNQWIAEQIKDAPECIYSAYVMPGDTVEKIESMLVHPLIKGLKCYRSTSTYPGNNFQSAIGDFLPESAWIVANKHHLTITLHLVRDTALADPDNLAYIKEMTAKYPNAVLILAHCARGFASWNTIEAARELKGIPNIYYDVAAICEPATIFETIRQAGWDKVMWGTDYCLSLAKGRPYNAGLGFTWLYRHNPGYESLSVASTQAESLLAVYQACLMLDATKENIEDFFYNNAIRLWNLNP